MPPQHGAWAFLLVPLLVGLSVAGWSWWGALFAVAWVIAYPVSYFGGRALSVRARRRSWTRLARREASRALPWLCALLVLGLPLVTLAPWLILVAGLLAAAWLVSLWLGARFGERSLVNDLALVGQAVCAVPLVWAVTQAAGPGFSPLSGQSAPAALWQGTILVGVFLAGSVLHVKSLLRQAGNRRFHWLSVGYHIFACCLAAAAATGWLLGFIPALARGLALRPGLRPAVIGAVETAVSVAFVAASFLVNKGHA